MSIEGDARFAVFILVSFVVFVFVLRLVLRRRARQAKWSTIIVVAMILVPAGMIFARWGTTAGLGWWWFYTVPALMTLVVPPVVFRMHRNETFEYLVLAALMAPAIHTLFSFFLGWHEYMPFLRVPSIFELTG